MNLQSLTAFGAASNGDGAPVPVLSTIALGRGFCYEFYWRLARPEARITQDINLHTPGVIETSKHTPLPGILQILPFARRNPARAECAKANYQTITPCLKPTVV